MTELSRSEAVAETQTDPIRASKMDVFYWIGLINYMATNELGFAWVVLVVKPEGRDRMF